MTASCHILEQQGKLNITLEDKAWVQNDPIFMSFLLRLWILALSWEQAGSSDNTGINI